MTPIDFARNLARDPETQPLAVALIARGLSDDTPDRAGWPLAASVTAAIRYLGLIETPTLIEAATTLAPKVSDAMLNAKKEVANAPG